MDSPAISLPPLNSHPVSDLAADASLQRRSQPPQQPSTIRSDLLFRLRLRLEYYNNPMLKGTCFPGLRFSKAYKIRRDLSCADINDIVSRILLDQQVVQFQLSGVTYTEGNGTKESSFFTYRDEFIEYFTRFLHQGAKDGTVHEVILDINKKVMMGESEFGAWKSYIRQLTSQQKMMYGRAIGRPRTESELIDEAVTYSNNNNNESTGAVSFSMDELKDIVVLDEDDDSSCVVCMEQCCVGSKLKRMPCSHVFHQECIVQWLETSHVCPLCRYKLHDVSEIESM